MKAVIEQAETCSSGWGLSVTVLETGVTFVVGEKENFSATDMSLKHAEQVARTLLSVLREAQKTVDEDRSSER